ncbi:hypothetical protein NO1_1753 [Candidatus Termititenax aidoneus]|uniref:Uncharacterized protein n=1 Tax=Termititenax aidoneus TaxID=2218524 RepID=A0A388TCL8_TERA1|nr:hypothetical protein NO1_1753 [Candidatus Termititenax aidoneus]
MTKTIGAYSIKLDARIISLMAEYGLSVREMCVFFCCTRGTFYYHLLHQKEIAEALTTGRQKYWEKQRHTKNPPQKATERKQFKTPGYISRKIDEHGDEVVNFFADALLNLFKENDYSFEGISNFEIAQRQIKYFLERVNEEGNT